MSFCATCSPIPRHLDAELPILGQDGFGAGAIAAVTTAASRRVPLLIAQVIRQLGTKGPLNQGFLEPLEQPLLARQILRLFVAGKQLVQKFRCKCCQCHRESLQARLNSQKPSYTELLTPSMDQLGKLPHRGDYPPAYRPIDLANFKPCARLQFASEQLRIQKPCLDLPTLTGGHLLFAFNPINEATRTHIWGTDVKLWPIPRTSRSKRCTPSTLLCSQEVQLGLELPFQIAAHFLVYLPDTTESLSIGIDSR